MPLIETEQQRMIAAPFIHLNGSSAKRLAEDYKRIRDLLEEAHKLMAETGPNGRDYYPERVNLYETARTEHVARMLAVGNALSDYTALYYHAEEQR